jgi:hypothetical protein
MASLLYTKTMLYSTLQAATEDEASEDGASPLPLTGRQCALLMRQLWQLSASSSGAGSNNTAAAAVAAAAAALQLEPRALATIADDPALSGTASDDLQCELQLHRRLAELQHWQVDTPSASVSDVVPSSAQPTSTAAAVAAAVAAAGGSRGNSSGAAKRSLGASSSLTALGGISEGTDSSSSTAAAADESDDAAAAEREQAVKLQLARHHSGCSSGSSSGADDGSVVYVKLRPVRYVNSHYACNAVMDWRASLIQQS